MKEEMKEEMIDYYLESIGHDFDKHPTERMNHSPSRGLIEVYCYRKTFPVQIDMLDLLAFVYQVRN
jgi:hypothetical protein